MTRSEWLDIFSDNLSSILEEKNITQTTLSEDSGISKGRISEYVNGISAPSIFAVINMAYALDVEVNELVDFDERIEEIGGNVYAKRKI